MPRPVATHRLCRLFRSWFRTAAVACVLALAAASPLQAGDYLRALDDVPLMPGLVEVPDAGLEFEAATGRIVEALATGSRRPGFDRAAVIAFYNAALPPLGWRPVTPTHFVRESEVLTLTVDEAPDRVAVRFGLKPRSP